MLDKQRARSEAEKSEREDSILTVAETLLRQSRYNGFTMQEVAEAASLAKGTFYLYFKSREVLVLASMSDCLTDGSNGLSRLNLN